MTDEVKVPFEGKSYDKAVLLLAAAEELGLPANVVKTNGKGAFLVPQEVHDKAFDGKSADDDEDEKPKTAKKTAAKKTAAKKSAAKNQE